MRYVVVGDNVGRLEGDVVTLVLLTTCDSGEVEQRQELATRVCKMLNSQTSGG